MFRYALLGATLAGTLGIVVPASGQDGFFSGLGDLSGGSFASRARAISPDGSTVVGYGTSSAGTEPFRWTLSEGLVGLGNLPGGDYWGSAWGVSADGSVIVGSSGSANGKEAFRWTATTGIVGLGDLPGGEFKSYARGVSADGNVIVGFSASGLSLVEGFRWTPSEGMVPMGFMDQGETVASEAAAVSADGAVIVGWSLWATDEDAEAEAFRWTAATGMVGLGFLPGGDTASFANAVSPDGSIVAGDSFDAYSGDRLRGYRWTAETGMVRLDPNGDEIELAYDMSANGRVIVGEGPNNNAVIWDALNGCRDLKWALTHEYGLDLAGWRLRQALGVSGDGTVLVGYGTNPSGKTEAWIAYLGWAPDDFPFPPDDGNGDDDDGDDGDGDDDGSYGNQWPPPWGDDPYGGDAGVGYGHTDDDTIWPDALVTRPPEDDEDETEWGEDRDNEDASSEDETDQDDMDLSGDESESAAEPPDAFGLLCPTAGALLLGVPLAGAASASARAGRSRRRG